MPFSLSSTTTLCLAAFSLFRQTEASCEPPIAFFPPSTSDGAFAPTLATIDKAVNVFLSDPSLQTSSLSIEITNARQSIWSRHHTSNVSVQAAENLEVDGSTVYMIASNTKVFTAMAILQLHALGRVNLDDAVTKYLPALKKNSTGGIEWDRISIRSLLSQQGGLPNNYAQSDLLADGVASLLGLPPVSDNEVASLPACDLNTTVPCDKKGLLQDLRTANPLFPPHVEASYSNVGFDLLGLVVEALTNATYEAYVTSKILKPLALNSTGFVAPSNTTGAVLEGESQWGQDLGIDNAAGGLYSSSDDMSLFLRHILNNHQTLSPTLNWLEPTTYSTGSHSFFGMPWEIFRTTGILPQTNRPVTFVTKGGGLVGYYSYIVLIPQHNLAVSLLYAGTLGSFNSLLETITTPLVLGAEALAQQELATKYTGTFSTTDLNSSLTISQSPSRSLFISAWISNGTEVLAPLNSFVSDLAGDGGEIYYQLVPTSETRQRGQQTGEVWRFYNVLDTPSASDKKGEVWNDYCVSNVDPLNYAGRAFNEAVFWVVDGLVDAVELTAFRARLARN
ncbi:hypothetical protein LTR62_005449 [Meristemomyces frigidus]|uniref:Beta-lactamase-related domain-containing protein n=1 Tax=Meristemomyces frigidus TaxID=1508187 RepID=A0AAN7YFA1_9PEZI|nr:hypothetical protein LTR62_005449 [Meristemomyces frigidus]